jgi:hypothetical protein
MRHLSLDLIGLIILALILFLLLAPVVLGDEPRAVNIDGVVQVQTFTVRKGEMLVIPINCKTPVTFWGLEDEPDLQVYFDSSGKAVVVSAKKEGIYKFALNTVVEGKATKPMTCRIVVGTLLPPVTPSVRPPVKVAQKVGKVRVVIVRKPGNGTEKVISESVAAVREMGHVLNPVSAGTEDALPYQAAVARHGVPVLVMVDAETEQELWSGPFPATAADLLDKVKMVTR